MDKVTILVWADGTWCNEDELHEYSWKSDDYARVTCNTGDEEEAVIAFNKI